MSRVWIVGLDGATLDLIEPWANQGKLPHLKRMMQTGVWGVLRSTVPPTSPVAWTSFMTGKNPGKHSVFGFREYDPAGYEESPSFVNSRSIQAETIWEILSRHGKRVGSVYVPLTYPPTQVDGIMVSGFLAPRSSAPFTHPPELQDEVRETDLWIEYMRENRASSDPGLLDKSQWLRTFRRLFEATRDITLRLLDRDAYDVFMILLPFTDGVSHYFWDDIDPDHPDYSEEGAQQYGSAILEFYQRCDRLLGEVWDRADEETLLLVVSDHGQGRRCEYYVRFNNWLREQGWLTPHKESPNPVTRLLKQMGIDNLRIRRAMERLGVMHHFREVLPKIPPAVKQQLPRTAATLVDVDWSLTQAYYVSLGNYPWHGICINTSGAKRCGIVHPGQQYDRLRQDIADRIEGIVDPQTGKQMVSRLYMREELYAGPHTNRAPDIVFSTHSQYRGTPAMGPEFITRMGPTKWSGTHRIDGVWLATGPGLRSGERLRADLIDIAPTVLAYLGLPILEDMDGVPRLEAFREPMDIHYEGAPEVQRETWSLSTEDEQEITDRLRGLGYLE